MSSARIMTALLKGMAVALLIAAAITLGIHAGQLLDTRPGTCEMLPVTQRDLT